ncbi:MAG: tRNA pseudouridine(54/55) synthase Pus10 [Planctomycetes bacterium]|nr:tRNA pseudouridine(54/55) synthase Pus10 [Planctomycetota bacterium]
MGPSFEGLLERILEVLRPFELRTFVIGFERAEGYDRCRHEREFRALKVALGEEIARRIPGVDADFDRPDLRIHVARDLSVSAQPAPLFLGGRYRKHSREIPATRWIHHACRGRGCPTCSYTGNLCGPSIQELLSEPVLWLSGGERTLFHALGREDTDARMLGRGRPFVLEVHRPLRRTLPLERVQELFQESAGDLAEVLGLRLTTREARSAVKSAAAEKTYRAWIEAAGPLPADAAERARALAGRTVDQASPERVEHRRGRGRQRLRRIVESSWLGEVEGKLVWEARVEAGTYVKELVSGDGGRTRPSLAEVLGVPCRCAALDVLEVHWDPPWEGVGSVDIPARATHYPHLPWPSS